MLSVHNAVISTMITPVHQNSSNEQLTLLVEWKQKYLVEEIITNKTHPQKLIAWSLCN